MKKTSITAIVLLSLFLACEKGANHLSGKRIVNLMPIELAQSIAEKFNPNVYFNTANPDNHYPVISKLDGNNKVKNHTIIYDSHNVPALYAFNYADNQGFVFVSADFQMRPILAFVQQGEFHRDTVPGGLSLWAEKTMDNIEIVRDGRFDNSQPAKSMWESYLDQNKIPDAKTQLEIEKRVAVVASGCSLPDPKVVINGGAASTLTTTITKGPLLSVTWGQSCTYNGSCQNKNCTDCSVRAVTGCVATSVAQIIRYWHPTNGYAYNYASMPASFGNGEVQRLMRDIGLPAIVNMNYGCAATGGSSASGAAVPGALKNHFGFISANRSSYGTSSYLNVKNNIDWSYPVLLEGCNDQTNVFLGIWYTYQNCHEWVCDGYQSSTSTICVNNSPVTITTLYFHMNWGWHEVSGGNEYNGWFAFNNWTINFAGGTTRNYQYARDIVTDIHS